MRERGAQRVDGAVDEHALALVRQGPPPTEVRCTCGWSTRCPLPDAALRAFEQHRQAPGSGPTAPGG